MSRHLKQCVGAEKAPTQEQAESDWEREHLRIARDQYQKKIRQAITSLENKDRVHRLGEATLETPVYVGCPDCPTRVKLETVVERGYVCPDHHAVLEDDTELVGADDDVEQVRESSTF